MVNGVGGGHHALHLPFLIFKGQGAVKPSNRMSITSPNLPLQWTNIALSICIANWFFLCKMLEPQVVTTYLHYPYDEYTREGQKMCPVVSWFADQQKSLLGPKGQPALACCGHPIVGGREGGPTSFPKWLTCLWVGAQGAGFLPAYLNLTLASHDGLLTSPHPASANFCSKMFPSSNRNTIWRKKTH